MSFLSVSPNDKFARLPFEEGRVRTSEHLSLTVEDTMEMLPFRNVYKATELFWAGQEQEWNPVLSVEDANEQYGLPDNDYGDGGVKFTKPITKKKAELIRSYKVLERERMTRLAKSNDSFGRTMSGLGAGLIAQGFDPINLGLMFVFPGLSTEKTAALGTKIGMTGARAVQATSGVAAGVTSTEPFSYLSKMFGEQNEYGPKNTMMNIAAGTLLGTTLNVGAGKLGDILSGTAKHIEKLPPRLHRKIINDAAEAAFSGEPMNPAKTVQDDVLETLRNNARRNKKRMDLDTDAGDGLKVTEVTGEEAAKLTPDQKLAKIAQQQAEEAAEARVKQAPESTGPDKLKYKQELDQKLFNDDRVNAPNGGHVYKYGDTEVFVEGFSIRSYRQNRAGSTPLSITVLNAGDEDSYYAVIWHILEEIDRMNTAMRNAGKTVDADADYFGTAYVNGRHYSIDEIHEFVTGKKPANKALLKNQPDSNLEVENRIPGTLVHGGADEQAQAISTALAARNKDLIDARLMETAATGEGIEGGAKVKAPKAKDAPAAKDAPEPAAKPKTPQEAGEADAAAQAKFEEEMLSLEEIEERINKYEERNSGRLIDDYVDDLDSTELEAISRVDDEMLARLDEELDKMGVDAEAKRLLLDELDTSNLKQLYAAIDQATDCVSRNM